MLPGKLDSAPSLESVLPTNLDHAVEQAIGNHPILKSANADIDSAFAST